MTSDFESFMAAGLDDALAVLGAKSFTVDGTSYINTGVLDQYTSSRELEIGGFVGSYDARIVCKRTKFSESGVMLERSLDGKTLVIDGRTFTISRVEMDETSVTFGLVNQR